MIAVPAPVLALVAAASSTVTTFGGDPSLAKSDPSNTTGLVVGIVTTLVIAVGALLLYLRHRKTAA